MEIFPLPLIDILKKMLVPLKIGSFRIVHLNRHPMFFPPILCLVDFHMPKLYVFILFHLQRHRQPSGALRRFDSVAVQKPFFLKLSRVMNGKQIRLIHFFKKTVPRQITGLMAAYCFHSGFVKSRHCFSSAPQYRFGLAISLLCE